MDPALLNYFQQQGSAPQQPKNPFDEGISKAIASARESLGMTQKQQDKALRNSMLSFGDAISQQPKQKGFFNNFGSVARALSPAIRTYDQEETASLGENEAMGRQILAYQAAEQARQDKLNEQAFWQNHAQDQLGEQRRSHDMMNNFRRESLVSNQPQVQQTFLGGEFIPIESKSERTMYAKDKKAAGEILHELSSIKKEYDQFKKTSEGDVIHPMSPYGLGTVANATKDFFGHFADNKGLKAETAQRKALSAKLDKFALELERKIKGGVLSSSMVQRFENKGILPSLADRPDVFESKLNDLMQEMDERREASTASLQYGAHISPYDLQAFRQQTGQNLEPEGERAPTMDSIVSFYDPDTNKYFDVPAEDAEIVKRENPNLVKQ